jgi:HSP20 family molecular chaperone IbpA
MDSVFNVARPWLQREEILPRMELVEYDKRYVVKVDIHDASAEGVGISLEAGVLSITSEDRSGVDDGACLLPRLHSFRYTLALPDDADETGLSIECEGRVLALSFDRLP